MKTRTVSIRGLFVLSIVLLFALLYVFERTRADRLQKQLSGLTAPLEEEIVRLKFDIRKRELAYQYAMDAIPPRFNRDWGDASTQELEVVPVGIRREAANLRNAKLKMDRKKEQLKELEGKLDAILQGS